MNKIFIYAVPFVAGVAAMLTGCSKGMTVKVTNELSFDRDGEMVELSLEDVKGRVGDQFRIVDAADNEVLYQITYDNKVIFRASVPADTTVAYTLLQGVPEAVDTVAVGYYYEHRQDDIA